MIDFTQPINYSEFSPWLERACAANTGQPWERGNLPAYGKAGFVLALCKERRFTALTPALCWGHPATTPHLSSDFQEIPPKMKFLQLPRPQQRPGTSLLAPSLPQLLPSGRGGSWWLLLGRMGSPSSPSPGRDRALSTKPRPAGFHGGTGCAAARMQHKITRAVGGGWACWDSNIFYEPHYKSHKSC